MLRAIQRSSDLPLAILRLGTAYGPGMRANAVFSRFSDAARDGQPIVVHGSGRQWRQFTHTSDIVRAVRRAVESDWEDMTVNVVTDEAITIRELAEIVSFRYGVPVEFGPERHGDPPSSIVSSAQAALLLGWRAQVDFHDGLAALLANGDAAAHRLASAQDG
jgi:nucleoside-diphosphate-sugar epimerase